jgi:predicted nuclease with TOPRIM domain
MSEETIKEIKEKIEQLEKRIDEMENKMKKLRQRVYERRVKLADLYDIELKHYKEMVNLKEYVKQLKKLIVNLHFLELEDETMIKMIPSDDLLRQIG